MFEYLAMFKPATTFVVVVFVQIFLASCVANEPSTQTDQISTEMPPLDLKQCEQSNIGGRYFNQGQDRLSGTDPRTSRLVWNLNHMFKLDARIEQLVSYVDVEHKTPNLVDMTAFDVGGKIIASAKLSADRKDYSCANGKIIILRTHTVYGEGSGTNRIHIKLSKTSVGDLDLIYERHFESLHYLIKPYRTTITANPVFKASR